ncbi:MAG: VCBS repeat-containing protein, partial [Kiritimatiellae bacterium]|nr:VCBS repeat-containing protein [Kiritimatiellia bacterium]
MSILKTGLLIAAVLLAAATVQLSAAGAFYAAGTETGLNRLKIPVPYLGLEGPYLRDFNNSGPYLGDLNNDGATDIAVSPWGGKPKWHRNPIERYFHIYYNQNGSFPLEPSLRFRLDSVLNCLIGDFDADAKADMAVISDSDFRIYPGKLDLGIFSKTNDSRVKGDGWSDVPFGLSDYGKLALKGETITAELCDFVGGARWRRLETAESGSKFKLGVFLPSDSEQWVDSRLTDLDGDKQTDVVVVSKQLKGYEAPGTNQVFAQDLIKIRLYYGPFPSMQVRPAELKRCTEITLPGTAAVIPLTLIAVADMNRDGKPDLVLTSGDKTLVFLQNPSGGFAPDAKPAQAIDGSDRRACVADVNHDGLPDLVVCRSPAGEIAVRLNKGGTIAAEPDQVFSCPDAQAIEMADLNGDGWPEIVARVNQGLLIFYNTQGKAPGIRPANGGAASPPELLGEGGSSHEPVSSSPGGVAGVPPSMITKNGDSPDQEKLCDDAYLMPYYTGNIYPTPQEAEYGDEYIPLADVGVLVGTDVTNPAPLVAVLTERIRRYGGQANVEESFNDKHG